MLPNFMIIGASRAGTTYLKKTLEKHPDIFMAGEGYTGDIHYFDRNHSAKNWNRGLEWYESFFKGRTIERLVGEKSALYFSDSDAPRLISEIIPDVKLIASLRNPIERAYSTFWYNRGEIPKSLTFLEACNSHEIKDMDIVEAGFYYKHLTNYLKNFPENQLHFVVFDNIKEDPLSELKKIFHFLDVDDSFIPQDYDKKINQAIGNGSLTYNLKKMWGILKQKNPVFSSFVKKLSIVKQLRLWVGKSSEDLALKNAYPPMSLKEWEYLSNLYYESNKKMGEFLGIDLISLWHNQPEKLRKG